MSGWADWRLMSCVLTAFEEVGLPIDTTRIRYLTSLPPFLARSMMLVTPVVSFVLDYSLKVSSRSQVAVKVRR